MTAEAMPMLWPEFADQPLLGTNGTEAMRTLLDRGKGGLVDFLKVGPFMGCDSILTLGRDYPLMLHLDDTLSGHAALDRRNVERIQDLVAISGTPWTSEHLGFAVSELLLADFWTPLSLADLLPRSVAMGNIVRNAQALAGELPVPLLLENVSFFPSVASLHICEPAFICEVLDATGLSLLLDLAHARVSASVLGCDVHDYLLALPLDRTLEIHLSGPRELRELELSKQAAVRRNAASVQACVSFGDDQLVDTHAALRADDYDLLSWVLERAQPKVVTLEYYADADLLEVQLERLGRLLCRPTG